MEPPALLVNLALGATEDVVGETELSLEMTRFTLRQFGVSQSEAQAIVAGLRQRG